MTIDELRMYVQRAAQLNNDAHPMFVEVLGKDGKRMPITDATVGWDYARSPGRIVLVLVAGGSDATT